MPIAAAKLAGYLAGLALAIALAPGPAAAEDSMRLTGTFSITGLEGCTRGNCMNGNAISHMSLYGRFEEGEECSPNDPNCNSVPEPGTLALLGLGLLGFGMARRKQVTRTF